MKKISVMIAGLPGKMATLVATAIAAQEDMLLHPYALSEESGQVETDFNSPSVMHFVPPEGHDHILKIGRGDIDMVVDFTQPRSVNRNAELYCENGIPFVMGTTGGERGTLGKPGKLELTVKNSNVSAVIATNMATPVVIFQEMISFAACKFVGSLEGYKLVIWESHQTGKPDPSGTAVSLLEHFAQLGTPLKKEQIIMLRDPVIQEVFFGIPKEHLGGHGFHTYTLLSSDGTVMLQFKHNVLGRNVYADGALKAIRFLAKGIPESGHVWSMAEVLTRVV